MNRITMLEGYQYMPANRALGDLGLFCSEIDQVLERLKIALAEADRVGVSGPHYDAAKAFYDRESSFFRASIVMLPWQCQRVTTDGQALLEGLNSRLQSAGGQTVTPPTPDSGMTGYIKTIVIVLAVGVGLVYLGPPLFALAAGAFSKPRVRLRGGRGLAGYRRKRRRS